MPVHCKVQYIPTRCPFFPSARPPWPPPALIIWHSLPQCKYLPPRLLSPTHRVIRTQNAESLITHGPQYLFCVCFAFFLSLWLVHGSLHWRYFPGASRSSNWSITPHLGITAKYPQIHWILYILSTDLRLSISMACFINSYWCFYRLSV